MSGGKWTPGPWRVDPRYPSDIQTANGKVEICTIDADGASGNVRHRLATPSGPTPVANARLIAAAPEMAEALEAVLYAYTQAARVVGLMPGDAEEIEAARALLARIKGDVT